MSVFGLGRRAVVGAAAVLLPLSLLLLIPLPASAQTPGVQGIVTNQTTGAAVSGVYVYAYDSSYSSVGYGYTNGTGNYSISLPLGGPYYLRTMNYVGLIDEVHNNINCVGCDPTTGTPVTVSGIVTINFALAPGGLISGTLINANTKTGIPNAWAEVYSTTGNYLTYGYTNVDGFYTILT